MKKFKIFEAFIRLHKIIINSFSEAVVHACNLKTNEFKSIFLVNLKRAFKNRPEDNLRRFAMQEIIGKLRVLLVLLLIN